MSNDSVMAYAVPIPNKVPSDQQIPYYTKADFHFGKRVAKIKMSKGGLDFEIEVETPITPEDMEWINGMMDMLR